MAKKKKPKSEDTPEVVHEEEAPLAADADEQIVVDADEEMLEAAEDAESEAAAHDDQVQAAEDDDSVAVADDDETLEAEDAETPPLKPAVTVLTLVLCVLTLLTAIGIAIVVALDHGKREEWSYAVFLHDLALMGLPLEEEAAGTSASRESLAAVSLDPGRVQKAYQERRTGGKGGSEPFQAVNELAAQRIRPDDIGPDTQKTIFQGLGEPVKTLEQEVDRIKKQVLQDIDTAAKETGKDLNNDAARRKLAVKVLLPLARTPLQVEALDKKIQAAKGTELSALLERGARLRMLAEILAPLEEQHPVRTKDNLLFSLAELDNTKRVDETEALVSKRIDAVLAKDFDPELYGEDWAGKQRTSMDKREAIAFLLYTVSQVRKPDGQLLYPGGPQRTEVVVGLNEYTHAADTYALALRALRGRVTQANEAALNYVFTNGDKQDTLASFVQRYPDEIKTIEDLRAGIKSREFRRKEYQAQRDQHQKQFEDRKKHYDEIATELGKERAKTGVQKSELDKLQQEYFAAQRRLADAAELNAKKVEETRKLERQQKGRTP